MVSLKKILVPTDFSELSKRAVDYALSLVQQYGAEMTLLTVVDDRVFQDGLVDVAYLEQQVMEARNESFSKRLEALRAETANSAPAKAKITSEMIFGVAFSEIVQYAKDNQTDLIVMGTHGTSGITHMLLGSTTEKVVRKAPCPVMIVRDKKKEE